MEIIKEQGESYEDCLRKMREKYEKYGKKVKVMTQEKIRIGGFLGMFTREGVEVTGILSNAYPKYGFETETTVKKPLDFEEEKQKILAQSKSDPTLQLVLSEVRDLKERMESVSHTANSGEDHQTISRIAEILALNDFTPSYTREILDRIKKEFSLDALDDYDLVQSTVVEWIGESITIYAEDTFHTRPRILVLVGPTGVGKTTTIAKLAAIYGIGSTGAHPLSVRMITIDNYRIAAKQQIETYGNIMGIPVSCVENYDDLRKTIALYSNDVDLILIDTIGKSPRDTIKLAEMKQLLSVCGSSAEVHLAVAASTKSSDIKEVLQQFEPFGYRSVIVTKLDETIRVGNVVSALSDKGKSVSYITDGQRVPMDIQRASIVKFLVNLEGFRINRQSIESRFPGGELEKINWR
ncbi:flagellar biosynthesis protein FlhF [Breznakiella homolactica]|uniref:Flagellar biosynthesis protein FlhF n=1 Tax=Breznakiella homolactica TaxID=2798577 RepID=A0A7T7XL68_9SPIR|nr:flagellar biosynthesis protein FlhF [Breznakiella homolactica]QQO08242.1 flagellar biosynthesis protein FlhF [Breznakiella homolactica]